MKKILYITSCDPEYLNGGSIGTRKIVETLEKLKEQDKIEWFGIVNKEKNMQNLGKYYLEIPRKRSKAYLSRILGYADQMELNINTIIEIIQSKEIDLVILQNSRLGNIAEKIKKKFSKVKIIQNFDNFEYEFAKMFTKSMNLIVKKIELYLVKKSEKKCMENMDLGIFLTKKDKISVENFYKIKKETKIIPFIYRNVFTKEVKIEKKSQVIFTGSLDMEANIGASLFLINNYRDLFEDKNLKLILAGRNPDNRIYKEIQKLNLKNNVKIISNPSKEKMEILLRESLFYISSVFEGSGMKTKVAEAIFYGLPIIASQHTMIGYEFLEYEKYENIKVFNENNILDLKRKIGEIENYIKIKDRTEEIRKIYIEKFSENNFYVMMKGILDEI